jgi:hypothetical protein
MVVLAQPLNGLTSARQKAITEVNGAVQIEDDTWWSHFDNLLSLEAAIDGTQVRVIARMFVVDKLRGI